MEINGDFNKKWDIEKKSKEYLFYLTLFQPMNPEIIVSAGFCADICDNFNEEMELHKTKEWTRGPLVVTPQISESLKKFVQRMKTISIDDTLYWHGKEQLDPLFLPYKMYLDSLDFQVLAESSMAYAMIGIESLLLSDDKELRHKLRLRAAKLLSLIDEEKLDPKKIFSAMGAAYDMRSKYVHGSLYDRQKWLKMVEKTKIHHDDGMWSVIDCLRLLLIIFLSQSEKKETIFTSIDQALISAKDEGILKELLQDRLELAKLTLV
jgi:hypothetical protein